MPAPLRLPVILAASFTASTVLGAQVRPDSVARDSSAQFLTPFSVRATRSRQSGFGAPLAITRVERDTWSGRAGFGLNDALSGVPGVLAQSRYGTSDVRLVIRGFGARGAGDRSNAGTSRGVRVLLDGMPETEPDGRTAFDQLDLATTERIDVIRSNASALWGNASGGVINVSTVPDLARPFSSVEVQSGSFGLQRYVAQTGAPVGTRGGVAYVGMSNTTFDGWRGNSDARRVTMNAGIAAPVGDHTRLRLHLTGANNLFHIPGPLSAQDLAANPRQANATYDGRDERRYNRLARLGASVEHDLATNQTISATAYLNPKYLQRSERGTFRDFTRYHGGGNVSYHRTDALSSTVHHRLTAGVDQAYQDGAILFYSLSATNGRGSTLRDNKKEGAYNSGVFVEDELTVRERLGITVGARGDAISYYYQSFVNPRLNASRTFSQVTPKLGLSWTLANEHMLYANVGGGVEAPAGNETDPASTFSQDTVTALNPLLEPIRSTTYEAGTRRTLRLASGWLRRLSYDGALYLTTVRNDIVPYRGGRFYFTAGEAQRAGAELAVDMEAAHGVRFTNSVTLSRNRYTDYRVDSVHYGKAGAFADYSGNRIVGIPSWFYQSALQWAPTRAPRGLSARVALQGTGAYFADDANRVNVPEAHILSATVRADRLLTLGDTRVSGAISVDNATDRRWIGSAFLNPDIVNGRALAFEPGTPRAIMVSVGVVRGR